MKHASLFSGIGGFDLAAHWMGWENVFNCEIEPFPRKILNYYWPDAASYQDIKETDFKKHYGTIDIISGGFPCQPYSLAGKRKGKEDDRHLWPEMLRAIREIKPKYVVGENVYGLVNWDGGLVFEEVQADLENEGYEVQPVILPACGKGAPHRRERVWFVSRLISDSNSERGCSRDNRRKDAKHDNPRSETLGFRGDFERWPTVPPLCFRNDGISDKLDGTTFPNFRRESIKGAGNAIVPQVAYEIFKVIQTLEND